MRLISFFIILLMWSLCLHAQNATNVDVRLSAENKEPMYTSVYDLIGTNEDGYYIARKQIKSSVLGVYNQEITLEKYTKDLKLSQVKVPESTVDKVKLKYTTAFMMDNKLYAIANAHFENEDKKVAYLQEINTKDFSSPEQPKEMLVMEGVSKIRLGSFELIHSPDKMLAAFVGLPNDGHVAVWDPKKRNEPATAIVGVFDADMQQKWSRVFQVKQSEKEYNIIEVDIDNDGNFYWLALNEDGKVDGKRRYSYFINAYTVTGEEPQEYPLSLEEKFISSCSFEMAPNGDIIVTGFYSEADYEDIKGVFYTRIDPKTKATLRSSFKEFNKVFMAEFMAERKANKGKELTSFDFEEIIVREDGGAVLIAQKYFVSTSTASSESSSRTINTYHYHELILTNINPNGDIDWVIRIPKIQYTPSSYDYLSYASMVKGDMLYLVFNDDEKNLTETKEDKIHHYKGKNGNAVLVTISPDGSWSKSALFNSKEEGAILRPAICEQINENSMLIYAEKKRTYKLGLITF